VSICTLLGFPIKVSLLERVAGEAELADSGRGLDEWLVFTDPPGHHRQLTVTGHCIRLAQVGASAKVGNDKRRSRQQPIPSRKLTFRYLCLLGTGGRGGGKWNASAKRSFSLALRGRSATESTFSMTNKLQQPKCPKHPKVRVSPISSYGRPRTSIRRDQRHRRRSIPDRIRLARGVRYCLGRQRLSPLRRSRRLSDCFRPKPQ